MWSNGVLFAKEEVSTHDTIFNFNWGKQNAQDWKHLSFKEDGGNKKPQVPLLSVLCIDQNPLEGICCDMQREAPCEDFFCCLKSDVICLWKHNSPEFGGGLGIRAVPVTALWICISYTAFQHTSVSAEGTIHKSSLQPLSTLGFSFCLWSVELHFLLLECWEDFSILGSLKGESCK